jgi:lysophospholipase L1-like esterase
MIKAKPLFLALTLAAALLASPAQAQPDGRWVGVWGFPPVGAAPPPLVPPAPAQPAATAPATPLPAPTPLTAYADVTLRHVVQISSAGSQVRVRLSNEFGLADVHIGAARIGLAGANGALIPGSDRVLTFAGAPSVTIPSGAPMLSDPVDLTVAALDQVAISLYLPEETRAPNHRIQQFVSAPGDHTGAAAMPDARILRVGALASRVEVVPTLARGVIVAFGDSITEGGYTETSFDAWPKRLAERLAASREGRRFAVVNAGISGNRMLHNGTGANALARFDRDVLAVPGVTHVIVLEGINDIGRRVQMGNDTEAVTTEQLIAAHRQLIDRAHANGLTIFGATLLPFEGAFYYDAAGDAQRQALNQWIRTSGAYDGVIDFDAATRDPANPLRMRTDVDRGDHLHPGPVGYAVMGDAIDLRLFTVRTRSR